MKAVDSLKFRFIGLLALFVIALIGVSAIMGIRQMSKIVVTAFDTAGIFTVEKAVSMIDGDSFQMLSRSLDVNDPYYEETRVKLFHLKESSGCKYLYTMAPSEGNTWRFIIDGSAPPDDTTQFSPLGTQEDTASYDAAFKRIYTSVKTEVSDLAYDAKWGWLISAYTPILNSAGRLVGIVGCDFDGTYLHNAIVRETVMQIIIGGITMITGFFLIILFFNLQKKVEEKAQNIVELKNALLKTMAEMVDCRDDNTGGHIERTQMGLKILMEGIEKNGIYQEETKGWDVDLLVQSCQLHDVGKISISDSILKKPGKLDDAEVKIMQQHAAFGEHIIKRIESMSSESDFLKYAEIFAASHHEKWDGTGYPRQHKEHEIPLLGRIMAIADVYDALISDRPYKKAFTHEEAVKIIVDGKGRHFDPVLVDLFTEVSDEFQKISWSTASTRNHIG